MNCEISWKLHCRLYTVGYTVGNKANSTEGLKHCTESVCALRLPQYKLKLK